MSEQHNEYQEYQEYQEYLKGIKPKNKREEFAFLMQIMPQTYQNCFFDQVGLNFKAEIQDRPRNNEDISVYGPASFERYYKTERPLKKSQKISSLDNDTLKKDYFLSLKEYCSDRLINDLGPEATTDLNRGNDYFGQNPVVQTQGMGQTFHNKIGQQVENWQNNQPDLPLHVIVSGIIFFVGRSDDSYDVKTKEGEIIRLGNETEEFRKIHTASKEFFSSINKDQLLFKVKGQSEKKSLSYLLKSSISMEEIFFKIKEEMAKNPILGKYEPLFFAIARIDTNPALHNEPINIPEFYYERSSLLIPKDEFIEKILKDFSPEFDVAYTAFKENPNYYTRKAVEDIIGSIHNKEERTFFLDWLICTDKRLEIHEEIQKIKNKFEEEFGKPFEEILEGIPEHCKSYQKSLNVKNLNLFEAEDKARNVSPEITFDAYFERYLRYQYALKLLSDPNEEPNSKMRKASKVLNELTIDLVNDLTIQAKVFLERFNDSVKNYTEIFSSEKKAEEKAKKFVCEDMREEAKEYRLLLMEDILETLGEMCWYDSKRKEWKIDITLIKCQLFFRKLNIYAELADKFAKSEGAGDRGDQMDLDIKEIIHCVPKFLGLQRNLNEALEGVIGKIQTKLESLIAVEKTNLFNRDLLTKAYDFHENLLKPISEYIKELRVQENIDAQEVFQILEKFMGLDRAYEQLVHFLNHGDNDSRFTEITPLLQRRTRGMSHELLGGEDSESTMQLFQSLKTLYDTALDEFKQLWQGWVGEDQKEQVGLKSILEKADIPINQNIKPALEAADYWYEHGRVNKGVGFVDETGGQTLFFQALIKAIRETETKNAVNDIKKVCQTYLRAVSNIKRENRFFSGQELNIGLVVGWINILDYPGYHRIEFCSQEGKRKVPQNLEKGVLYLEKRDNRIQLHSSCYLDHMPEPDLKTEPILAGAVIHKFTGSKDAQWPEGEITREEDEELFQKIAEVCNCKYTPKEKLKKIRDAVNENFGTKTSLWAELIDKILEILKYIGFDIPEKTPEERFKKDLTTSLKAWEEEQNRGNEAMDQRKNVR